jgi:two-component system chemotaxis response regulator CheB
VYFAGSGYHLSVEQDFTFSLSCEPPVHFARPAIDVLMESSADAYGPAWWASCSPAPITTAPTAWLIFMRSGGLTVVQDPDDAQVATMPKSAIDRFSTRT